MEQCIVVSFGKGKDYEFRFHDRDIATVDGAEARRWIDQEFAASGLEPANPVGKAVMPDKILALAKGAGESAFAGNSEWARKFLRYAVAVLGRPSITLDIPGSTVGY